MKRPDAVPRGNAGFTRIVVALGSRFYDAMDQKLDKGELLSIAHKIHYEQQTVDSRNALAKAVNLTTFLGSNEN